MRREFIEFEGKKYGRWPDHPERHKRCYFWWRYESLHRAIWKSVHGDIPKGAFVHHIDGNPLNNNIYNLALMQAGEHARHHFAERKPVDAECVRCGALYSTIGC